MFFVRRRLLILIKYNCYLYLRNPPPSFSLCVMSVFHDQLQRGTAMAAQLVVLQRDQLNSAISARVAKGMSKPMCSFEVCQRHHMTSMLNSILQLTDQVRIRMECSESMYAASNAILGQLPDTARDVMLGRCLVDAPRARIYKPIHFRLCYITP